VELPNERIKQRMLLNKKGHLKNIKIMNRKLVIFFIGILLISVLSCKTYKQKYKCYNENKYITDKDPLHKEVKKALNDSLIQWASRNIKYAVCYANQKKNYWEIGDVLFNKKMDKCFTWTMIIENDTLSFMDEIKFFGGELAGDKWHFYHNGFPSISVPRQDPSVAFSINELRDLAIRNVIQGGFIKDDCKVNYGYINDWFNPNFSLKEKHIKFINDVLPH
jgi:hypothetical protein